MGSFRPLIRGLSISSESYRLSGYGMEFPSPHPGIINFFANSIDLGAIALGFPSPHPGIINFFLLTGA